MLFPGYLIIVSDITSCQGKTPAITVFMRTIALPWLYDEEIGDYMELIQKID